MRPFVGAQLRRVQQRHFSKAALRGVKQQNTWVPRRDWMKQPFDGVAASVALK